MQKVILSILGAKRFDFNGISGTKVFSQQESDSFNDHDVVGIEVLECSGPLSVFDDFKNQDFPCSMLCEVRFTRGAGGKAGMRILSAQPVAPAASAKSAGSASQSKAAA